ncbi:hypothetical protein ACIRPX_23510 [Streptomyces sp. NPDC101225]|uniref:hypothetical protein n=1 Tax=Streptomyces sp. NPDC101225 TaxID=3366135 RepID=UPI00380575C6
MSVFARLLRRSRTTEEASTAEAPASPPTAGPAAAEPSPEAAEATGRTGDRTEGGPTKPETAEDTPVEDGASGEDNASPEGVEIPRQQSGGQPADSEAGENARR